MRDAQSLSWLDVVGPDTYAKDGYPHEAWRVLREQAPIRWFDLEGGTGFWSVVRRADIVWLSKQPDRFVNAPRLAVFERGGPIEERDAVRQLLNMDPPEHGQFRAAASHWFTPRAIRARHAEVDRITRELLDEIAGDGEEREADFVGDFAAPLTLAVLADMLGVPREDWRLLFEWTNAIAGSADPEYQDEEDPQAQIGAARDNLFGYFGRLAADRLKNPKDDITSVLTHAKIEGDHLPPLELLSYFLVLVVAGNETTRNAASGGLMALIDNPGEFEKLRANPDGVDLAVEEIVRWTAPVVQFCRTAVEDVELHGQKIAAGDALCLFYPSANRDAEHFEDPDRFRVDRRPNPHLGFGIGEHYCLGANLARLELRAVFGQLAERMEAVELSGPFERMRSSFLGGVKRMPIRYRLRPSA